MSDFQSRPGDDPALALALAVCKTLEERLLPIVRATVAPLLRVGVHPPGNRYEIVEPPPIGEKIITYGEGGDGPYEWGVATEEDWERYRAQVKRWEAGRQLGQLYLPEMEETNIDLQTGVSVCGVLSVFQNFVGMHRSYPRHADCPDPPSAGPDLLPPCTTDEDLAMFLEKDMLDPRNFRAVLRQLHASFTAESALFSLLSDLLGFDYRAVHP